MVMDIVLKNGISVQGDPIEIAIKDKKIYKVDKEINLNAVRIIDLKNSFVSYGWIDGHVHCDECMNIYYDSPDELGVKQGVCTIVDAGSTGADNVGRFYENTREAKTNVFALLNISKIGIVKQNELSDSDNIRFDLIKSSIEKYPDFILGLKARMSSSVVLDNGLIPLEAAKTIQGDLEGIPLMVHIGNGPPKLRDIFELLDKGDMVTHCFNGKENGILDSNGEVEQFVWDALKRGVVFDVGHGTDSFSFEVAEKAFSQCFYCQTVSTDSYQKNRINGPVYNMATMIEKMLSIGYSLPNVIEKVTANTADFYGLSNKGKLIAGFDADITVFDIIKSDKILVDSVDNKRNIDFKIIPKFCVVGGEVYDVDGGGF